MYFSRYCNYNGCYNRNRMYNGSCRGRGPGTGQMMPGCAPVKSPQAVPSPVRKKECSYLKCTVFGGMTVTADHACDEKDFDLAVINLDLSGHVTYAVELGFVCNLVLMRTGADLTFRLVKLQDSHPVPLPVMSPVAFVRIGTASEAETVSFHLLDCDSMKGERCSYLVKLHIGGRVQAGGSVSIVNPTLTALVTEQA